MDAEQALCLTLGVAIAILGVTLLVRVRPGPERTVFAASFALIGVFFALWPPESCSWLDHVTGIVGAGILVWACSTTIALGLQVTFHHRITDRQSWWVRATPVLATTTIVTYAIVWMLVRLTAGRRMSHLLYDGYHGEHAAILIWNLTLGMGIACVSGLAAREQRGGTAAYSPIMGGIYTAGVVYGLLIAAQALASHLGYGAAAVTPVLRGMRLVAIMLATGCALWSVVGTDIWALGRLWWETRHLRHDWHRLTYLLIILSDRLVQRYAPEASNAIALLARRYAPGNRLPNASRQLILIALQAARRIAWRRGTLVGRPWGEASPSERELAERSIAAEAAHDIATGNTPLADIGYVVRLLLADVQLPAWLVKPLPPPTDDHLAAAALVAPHLRHLRVSSQQALLRGGARRQWTRWGDGHIISSARRVRHLMHATHGDLVARHAQAEMDLLVCCELIEDYLLQMDAPDDHDLAVHAWVLGGERHLSPLQTEITQRASQILGLFGPHAVTSKPPAYQALLSTILIARRRYHPSATVALWSGVAEVIEAVLDPTHVPADAWSHRRSRTCDGEPVAELVRQAAQSARATGRP